MFWSQCRIVKSSDFTLVETVVGLELWLGLVEQQ
jgi:hypothetical protein